jgi:phosphoketolase
VKIRFVNVVDLFRLMPEKEHPHGLSDKEFDSLFTKDKPVIFNFHAYASLIHKFTYNGGRTMTTSMCAGTRRRATSIRRWSWRF